MKVKLNNWYNLCNQQRKHFATIITIIICICVLFSGCGGSSVVSQMEQYAKDAYQELSLKDDPEEIYIIKYTNKSYLNDDEADLSDVSAYDESPSKGYAILFYSYSIPAFSSYAAVFLTESGRISYVFDYAATYKKYEDAYADFSPYNIRAGERALEYLSNCSFFSGMSNYVDDVLEGELPRKMENNTWYIFSEKSIEKIIG